MSIFLACFMAFFFHDYFPICLCHCTWNILRWMVFGRFPVSSSTYIFRRTDFLLKSVEYAKNCRLNIEYWPIFDLNDLYRSHWSTINPYQWCSVSKRNVHHLYISVPFNPKPLGLKGFLAHVYSNRFRWKNTGTNGPTISCIAH